MNALPGAAVTSEPWGRGDVEIFIYLLRPQFDSFLGGKQCVTAAVTHAVKFRNTPRTHWGDLSELDSVFCCSTAFLLICKGKRHLFLVWIPFYLQFYLRKYKLSSCGYPNLRIGAHMTTGMEEKSHVIRPYKQMLLPFVQSQTCTHAQKTKKYWLY